MNDIPFSEPALELIQNLEQQHISCNEELKSKRNERNKSLFAGLVLIGAGAAGIAFSDQVDEKIESVGNATTRVTNSELLDPTKRIPPLPVAAGVVGILGLIKIADAGVSQMSININRRLSVANAQLVESIYWNHGAEAPEWAQEESRVSTNWFQ